MLSRKGQFLSSVKPLDIQHRAITVRRAESIRCRTVWGALALVALLGQTPAGAVCVGDCNTNGVVTIDELVRGVNVALDNADLAQCQPSDRDGNGFVTVDELVTAVRNALAGCPTEGTATATPTPTPSPSISVAPITRPPSRTPTATATSSPTSLPGNRPPLIVSTPATVARAGVAYAYNVRADDLDGDALTFSLDLAPEGMAIDPGDGALRWTPATMHAGIHDVTVRATDPAGAFDVQSFALGVGGVAEAPIGVDDVYEARVGETLRVSPAGVIANDSDPNGDVLTAIKLGDPQHGALTFNTDGSFDYTPEEPVHAGVFTRVQAQAANLSLALPNPLPSATSVFPSSSTYDAFDGDLTTSWFTLNVGTDVFYELEFHADITVDELRMFGNRTTPNGRDFLAGRFQLLDRNGVEIYDSGEVALPAPDRDLTLDTGTVANVRRVRFTSNSFEGNDPGFAELHVIGDGEIYESNVTRVRRTDGPRAGEHPVTSTQIVIDLNDDGIADIFTQTNTAGIENVMWTAYDGASGTSLWQIPAFAFATGLDDVAEVYLTGADSPAAGDLDGDGRPEILIAAALLNTVTADRLIALAHDGTVKWLGEPIDTTGATDSRLRNGGPAIADLDGDRSPEIVVGYANNRITVFDANGKVVRHAVGGGNTETGSTAPAPVVADIDLDGRPEILYGDDAYAFDGSVKWSGTELASSATPLFHGVGNLDDDPYGEVVVADARDRVTVFEHDGVVKWRNPDAGIGGPFSIADIDADGAAEIIGGTREEVRVLTRTGAVKWTAPLGDEVTAYSPTAFDFDADGIMEVLYQDNSHLYFFDGATGRTLVKVPSVTFAVARPVQSQPLIADVDGDGSAEVLVREAITAESGIHVLGPKTGTWPETRPIWNQVSYQITNVEPDGGIPAPEPVNWLTPGLNDFRVNVPLPEERVRSRDSFTYRVHDGALESNVTTVHLDVLPDGSPPRILSQADGSATVGFPYSYRVFATDPDVGDVLTYALSSAPTGMTIDASSGHITWTPDATQLGEHAVGVTVADSMGFASLQAYTLTVDTATIVPDLIGQPRASAQSAITSATLTVGAVDETTHPTVAAGLVIAQTPPPGAVAERHAAVSLSVSLGPDPGDVDGDGDGVSPNQGDCDDESDTVHPGAADAEGDGIDQNCDGGDGVRTIARIVVAPLNPIALIGERRRFTATAEFNDGTAQDVTTIVTWSSSAPNIAAIDAEGVVQTVSPGSAELRASKDGKTGSSLLMVHARVGQDDLPPTVALTSPAADAAVTGPIEVRGTATDDNFLRYELAFAAAGESTFTTIASGTSPVDGGVLGMFDPTLLRNDQYEIRLTAFDRGGNELSTSVIVQVEGNQKVGLFTLTFTDLSLPLSGLPLQVNRTYDSRDKRRGDFGVGWRLDLQTLQLRVNRVPGTAWDVRKSRLSFTLVPTDMHKVTITLPDGHVEEFDLVPRPAGSAIVPLRATSVRYVARPGTLGTLRPVGNTNVVILDNQPGPVELLDDETFNVYNPQRFQYTTGDGRVFIIHRTAGVESLRDPNGNTLTIAPGGISHSSGKAIDFVRDAAGRIVEITDPKGGVRRYSYDARGDLISSTDQAGNTTRYRYNLSHGLLDIQDPTGTHAARNEYDADGRLVATVDAQGNRVTFTHEMDTQQEVARDRSGNVTVFDYDTAGNVVARTDALGHRSAYTYDSRDNQLTETDPLGRVASRTYDDGDRVLTSTDFDGNTTAFTYNARAQVLTTTDPEGHVTTNVYSSKGNLLQVIDAAGGVTQHTYDATGNRLATIDPLGNATTFAYDDAGNRVSETDPSGSVTSYTYDANGNRLSENRTRTLPGGAAQTITTQFIYDGRNRATKHIDAMGGELLMAYSPSGDGQKPANVTDKNGRAATFTYDPRGEIAATTFADASTELRTRDAEGRLLSLTNRDGRTSSFRHDALGRDTGTTHPDGATTGKTYDAVGRLLTETDERGNVTTYSYAANQQTVTDAAGNATIHALDSRGRRIRTTDALGRITRYEYDHRGNVTRTTFPDGSTYVVTYDLAGRRTAETDQAGQTTHYDYDAVGRLIQVRDAGGGLTSFDYDEVGNLIAHTDGTGRTTRLEYDPRGRLTRRIRPMGQAETFTYDANGNQLSHTNFNGTTTTFTYDASNRLLRKTFSDATSVSYAYTPAGLRTEAGEDAYAYDVRGRLTQETKASGEVVSYTYDPKGNRTSVTTAQGTTSYSYDALNRLADVTDASGTTTYSYDAVGNLARTMTPNGVITTYTYNSLNRLTEVRNVGPSSLLSSYTYTLGPVGNRLRVVEAGPATTGRSVSYAYDPLYRLIDETIDEPGQVNDQSISYVYDAVGNRLSKFTIQGARATDILYAYDDNDRLLSETTVLTIARELPGEGPRYVLAGYGFSPGAVLIVSIVLLGRRRSGLSRRAWRRLLGRAPVALLLVSASVFVPTMGRVGLVDSLGPQTAAAQNATTIAYAYDANGNTLSRSDGTRTDTYTYDTENRLITADLQMGTASGLVRYTYDADGIRNGHTVRGVTTTFLTDKNRDFAQVLVETTGSSAVAYSYGHERLSMTRPGTSMRFYQYDGPRSTRQLTDAAGAVTDRYTYDAFGVLLSSSGTTRNDFLYRGEQLDPNVGFYYLRARYYAQALGRFVTPDPFVGSIYEPRSLHRYLYAYADPINNRDPSGMVSLLDVLASIFLIGLLAAVFGVVAAGNNLAGGFGSGPKEAFDEGALYGAACGIALVFGLAFLSPAVAATATASAALLASLLSVLSYVALLVAALLTAFLILLIIDTYQRISSGDAEEARAEQRRLLSAELENKPNGREISKGLKSGLGESIDGADPQARKILEDVRAEF